MEIAFKFQNKKVEFAFNNLLDAEYKERLKKVANSEVEGLISNGYSLEDITLTIFGSQQLSLKIKHPFGSNEFGTVPLRTVPQYWLSRALNEAIVKWRNMGNDGNPLPVEP